MLQAVKGTRDLLPGTCRKFRHVEQTASQISSLYGFDEIETPILEPAALFLRSLGDTSDIVSKEMYRFTDAGGDDLVLRPEGTAGVARALISEGLAQDLPLKLFYRGPMFRRERPQKGRYRQFYQCGVELLGVDSPAADLEVIACGYHMLQELGLSQNLTLRLNSIGDADSRAQFREALKAYFQAHRDELSQESQDRLERNPLRILDSKDARDRKLLEQAPRLADSLTPAAFEFFRQVQDGLKALKIPVVIDPLLVRGLDYYCHTVFEFTTENLGAQNAVLAGGRYDGLVSDLGGPRVPGVGWAFGTDRLVLLLDELQRDWKNSASFALIPVGERAEKELPSLAQDLRRAGLRVDLSFSGNVGKRMKRADKVGALAAVIFGDNELNADRFQIKALKTGTQSEVPRAQIITELQRLITSP
jgi:histidyl-tRNA synthetase